MLSKLTQGISQWKKLGLFGNKPLWQNARMVFAEIPVDKAQVKDWLPFPLSLATPSRATVFIADYPQTTFSAPYREAAILLHVKVFGVFNAVYCPWMVVDDDRAMILGREMLGYPKKMAEFTFEEKAGQFTGTVSREGHELMRIEGKTGPALSNPQPGIGQWAVNLRALLGIMPAHLLLFHPRETIHEARQMDLTVNLNSSEFDPVGIASGKAENGSIRTCDIDGGAARPPIRFWPVASTFQARQMQLRLY